VPFANTIDDHEGLRELYRMPHANVFRKSLDHVDDGSRAFIAACPFVVVSTSGPNGHDASPRGGPPGWVAVLDRKRVALGDLAGNNRLDSLGNIVENPAIGLLFLIPGVDECLRINGRASITLEDAVLDAATIDGRRPKVAVGVDVEECYIHCAKALRRSGLWDPASWSPERAVPSAAAIWRDQLDLDVPAELIEQDLEAGYQATMWCVGGDEG
jgi:PPOX class probable FMN-dependent enzyme